MFDGSFFALAGLGVGTFFAILIFWSIVWKGFALWISAREKNKTWFIIMLIINTAGILEIIYIFGFSKWGKDYFTKIKEKRENKKKEEKESKKD